MNHYEEVSEGNKDNEDDDTSNAAASQDEPCTISYCNCPCASDMLYRRVCYVFLNYLRHVRLVQNLFTVVCNGFCHATACLMCVSLTSYFDVIPMVYIV